MNLHELAIKHSTDKAQHNYMPFYEEMLPDEITSILEIGVLRGESISMWKEAFPEAKIMGMDLFIEYDKPAIPDVKWFKGSQVDSDLLYHIRNDIKPQIIVEDASHDCVKHWVTLFNLISCCDYYFIEDLHTCRDPFYREGLTFDETVLGSMLNKTFPFFYILSADQKIAVIKSYSKLGRGK